VVTRIGGTFFDFRDGICRLFDSRSAQRKGLRNEKMSETDSKSYRGRL
jgi:hypothetical protein